MQDDRQDAVSSALIERTIVKTRLSYDDLVRSFESELQRLDPAVPKGLVEKNAPWSEVERTVAEIAGPYGLMIIAQANQGLVTSLSGRVKRCSLYLVGNPVIANGILDVDPLASLYVPFRVCIYDDGVGAALSYDRPSSLLGSLGRPELTEVGHLLDAKIDGLAHVLKQGVSART